MNRRKFLRNTAIGALTVPFVPYRSWAVQPSEKIRVAHIGLGNMGRNHLNWFAAFPDVDIVGLCDVDEVRLAEKHELLKSIHPKTKAKTYADFRHILDRKDVDVVTCATPDHWHPLVATMASEAGKDVYGEKPLSYSIAEGKTMLNVLSRNNSIFQLGTQIHAGDNYHRVVELVRSGKLGKIHTARLWKTGGSRGYGWPRNIKPPETLDWNMWLGPAPYIDYTPVKCHGSFRHFFDFSGGVFGDFWCHIADVVFWALKPEGLSTIVTRGESPKDGIADTPHWIEADFKFKDLNIHWTTEPPDIPWAKGRHIGAYFEGTKGSLICDYAEKQIYIGNEVLDDIEEVPVSITRSPGHQRNFLDSVKSRKQPESNIAYAQKMAQPMHLALISFRLKRALEWDSGKDQFVNDKAANYLLSRKYRAPWNLPE